MMRVLIAPLVALWMLVGGSAALAQCGTSLPGGTVCGNNTGSLGLNGPLTNPVLGIPGASVGSLSFANATSGTVKLQPTTGALGSSVLSLPAISGMLAATAGLPTVNGNFTCYSGTAAQLQDCGIAPTFYMPQDVRLEGAICDSVLFYGTTHNGTTTIDGLVQKTLPNNLVADLAKGIVVYVGGDGVPANTTVISYAGGSSITTSAPSTANASVFLWVGADDHVAIQTASNTFKSILIPSYCSINQSTFTAGNLSYSSVLGINRGSSKIISNSPTLPAIVMVAHPNIEIQHLGVTSTVTPTAATRIGIQTASYNDFPVINDVDVSGFYTGVVMGATGVGFFGNSITWDNTHNGWQVGAATAGPGYPSTAAEYQWTLQTVTSENNGAWCGQIIAPATNFLGNQFSTPILNDTKCVSNGGTYGPSSPGYTTPTGGGVALLGNGSVSLNALRANGGIWGSDQGPEFYDDGYHTSLDGATQMTGTYLEYNANGPCAWVTANNLGGLLMSNVIGSYCAMDGIYNVGANVSLGDGQMASASPLYGSTVTISIASPAVVSYANNGLSAGQPVKFSTTGALPTGITAGTAYYVISAGLSSSSFEFSATVGGAAINTSGSQSGIQTATPTYYAINNQFGGALAATAVNMVASTLTVNNNGGTYTGRSNTPNNSTTNTAITIVEGGTGLQTITAHGVMLGEGTSAVAAATPGTNGQLFLGVTGADSAFATMSGDATIANTGALTLKTVNSNTGTWGDATHVGQITLDAQGRATAAASVAITGTAPGGSAGGALSGTYPNPTLATAQPDVHTWALAQTFTTAPVFTDQSGSRTALGLGSMATQAASSVAITGGTIAGLTGLAIRDTSAAFDVTMAAASSTALTAGRTLTFDVVNGARTLKLGSNLTLASDPGAVTGAMKSNGSGTFGQAACADLSNGATGCSTATGTSGTTIALNNGNNAFSGNDTFSGQAIHTGTSAPSSAGGNTVVMGTIAAPSLTNTGQAFLYNTVAGGAILQGDGSTSDVTLSNKAGTGVLSIPTGTASISVAVGGTNPVLLTNYGNYGMVTLNGVKTAGGYLGMFGGASGDTGSLYFNAPGAMYFSINGSNIGILQAGTWGPYSDNAVSSAASGAAWSAVYSHAYYANTTKGVTCSGALTVISSITITDGIITAATGTGGTCS